MPPPEAIPQDHSLSELSRMISGGLGEGAFPGQSSPSGLLESVWAQPPTKRKQQIKKNNRILGVIYWFTPSVLIIIKNQGGRLSSIFFMEKRIGGGVRRIPGLN